MHEYDEHTRRVGGCSRARNTSSQPCTHGTTFGEHSESYNNGALDSFIPHIHMEVQNPFQIKWRTCTTTTTLYDFLHDNFVKYGCALALVGCQFINNNRVEQIDNAEQWTYTELETAIKHAVTGMSALITASGATISDKCKSDEQVHWCVHDWVQCVSRSACAHVHMW